ncbi:hypothetical protein ATCC27039_21730 [Actinomyces naeslundii]|nr:hypothetical protein ATCC27039_21730 [Actinomyces naeslundii]
MPGPACAGAGWRTHSPSVRQVVRNLIADDELRSAPGTSVPPLRRVRTLRPKI